MTLVAEQLTRIRDTLQDTSTTDAVLIAAHQEALRYLARRGAFTNVLWLQCIADQALYVLPATSVQVLVVLYNQVALRFATEALLDRRFGVWEQLTGEPQYWTMDNQAPNTIRLIPPPVRPGSAIPVIPPVPMLQSPVDNLVIFLREDVANDMRDPADLLPTLDDWNDLLVWRTVRQLAERETEHQNLQVAALCKQLEELWEEKLGL